MMRAMRSMAPSFQGQRRAGAASSGGAAVHLDGVLEEPGKYGDDARDEYEREPGVSGFHDEFALEDAEGWDGGDGQRANDEDGCGDGQYVDGAADFADVGCARAGGCRLALGEDL